MRVSFKYAFETAGTLRVWLDDQLLAELVEATGSGPVDDAGDFGLFSAEFRLADYGLDPTELHELRLELLAGSAHTVFLDDLQVLNPKAAPVPEPASLCVFAGCGVLLVRRRRAARGQDRQVR